MNKLLAALAFAAVFTSGCVVETVPTCDSNVANFTVINVSNETVDVVISGPTPVGYALADDTQRTDALVEGTYRVTATGRATGLVLSDSTNYFSCDSAYDLTLTPAQPPVVEYAELDIANDTNENLLIYLDGIYENKLLPGQIGQYAWDYSGYHDVVVVQEDTGFELLNVSEYFAVDTVTVWSITSTHPEVEIHNLLTGSFAECVNTFVDDDAINFGTESFPIWDVCPFEIGSFALYHGDYALDVFGQDFGYHYVETYQHFPENTVTIFEIE